MSDGFAVYPAIDLRGGRVVRLQQGDFHRETTYGDDPAAQARAFVDQGAAWLHVVDLDAARSGEPVNRAAIAAICEAARSALAGPGAGARVQCGGGIRDDAAAAVLFETGVERVVVGTAAVEDPGFAARLAERWPGRVAVGLDVREREVATRGWVAGSGRDIGDVLAELTGAAPAAFVVTQIARDGMLAGPDLDGLRSVLGATPVPVIASGGVGSLDDLRALQALEADRRRLDGVIVGQALYARRFTLGEALAVARVGGR